MAMNGTIYTYIASLHMGYDYFIALMVVLALVSYRGQEWLWLSQEGF